METNRTILTFRWIVFGLACFYLIESFIGLELEKIGWQFRFLTNWALALSCLSAFFMLRRSQGKTQKRYEVLASSTVVLNIMVVALYWQIYLSDPTSFYVDGVRTIPLWKEYYLHGLGPLLQLIDAFLILGAFRPAGKILATIGAISIGYSVWLETLVRPLNSDPVGTVTSGLPYRFLNNMSFDERLMFYAQNVVSGLFLVGMCCALTLIVGKIVRPTLYAPTIETDR